MKDPLEGYRESEMGKMSNEERDKYLKDKWGYNTKEFLGLSTMEQQILLNRLIAEQESNVQELINNFIKSITEMVLIGNDEDKTSEVYKMTYKLIHAMISEMTEKVIDASGKVIFMKGSLSFLNDKP